MTDKMHSRGTFIERVNHSQSITRVFERLLENSSLLDCTVAAEGQYLKAHRVILSACSPYFELLFNQEHGKNPIVVLKDTRFEDLKAVIDFIYRGYIEIPDSRLCNFLDAIESLQIQGINVANEKDNAENREKEMLPVHGIGGLASAVDFEHARRPSSHTELSCSDEVKAEPEMLLPSWSPFEANEVVMEDKQRLENCEQNCDESNVACYIQRNTSQLTPTASEACDSSDHTLPPESRIEILSCKTEFSCDDAHGPPGVSQVVSSVEQSALDALREFDEEETSIKSFPSWFECTDEPKDKVVVEVNRSEKDKCTDNQSVSAHRSLNGSSAQRETSGARLLDVATPPLAAEGSKAPRHHPCPLCAKAFPMSTQLKVHLLAHTEGRPYRCSQCPKTFKRLSNLNAHLRSHTDRAPVSAFGPRGQTTTIAAHPVVAAVQPPTGDGSEVPLRLPKMHRCPQCAKVFWKRDHLSVHLRIHTGERPHQCHQCSKAFTTANCLKVHQRTHTGERPYRCPQCPKTFSRSDNMKAHLPTHRGERPYRCARCPKTFKVSANLKKHLRRCRGQNPFSHLPAAACASQGLEGAAAQ